MKNSETNHHIYVLTGPVQGGKTTFVTEMVKQLITDGIRVSGFLCPGTFSDNRRSDFHLTNIETGFHIPMASVQDNGKWVKYRRFYFNPEAFIQGSKWILDGLEKQPDLVVIDEVGPMELEGMGWSDTLHILQNKSKVKQLWIVREQILPDAALHWKIPEENIFSIESFENHQALNRLIQK